MFTPFCRPSPHTTSTHNYGTRIRKNSVLKPSSRLRQGPPSPLPASRKIKPVPVPVSPARHPVPLTPDSSFPVFPIPGVMLHPEDASNKVFHAIGRSLLSVENRAMTIKDLAEMTLKYGLMCQNVSAASQAITTYIRNHITRCDAQDDHPLLLRHVLSGTLADDDLVPALYSRIGGATNLTKSNPKDLEDKNLRCHITQGPLDNERLTNFRRGTMVWYLSKAAGVSCPFARAGIRLCEYGKEGRKIADEHDVLSQTAPKAREDSQCGEKRKRLSRYFRRDSQGSQGCSSVGRDSESPVVDSGYGELDAGSSDDEPPPKVRLTLRLSPSLPRTPTPAVASRPREVIDLSNDMTSSSSEDDDTCLDLDPSEAPWSLPPYPRRSISVPSYTPTSNEWTHHSTLTDERRRSPSVPYSASPPPDSDHDDFDLDLDSDVDWDSLSAPSPIPALRVKVETTDDFQPLKTEVTDMRDMLDAWEDLDCVPTSTVSSATIKLPTMDDLKSDALEFWEWEFESGSMDTSADHEDLPVIKMEPDEHECLSSFKTSPTDFPLSPWSPSTFHRSSSPSTETFQSPLSPCAPSSLSSFPNSFARGDCALAWQDAELLGPDSVQPHEFEDGWTAGVKMRVGCSWIPQYASDVVSSPLSVEPEQGKINVVCELVKETHESWSSHSANVPVASDTVVVHTCRPCTPDIYATQIEGIPVYQTMLGSTLLLRRIDTDFVNLSTILSYLSLSPPSPLPNASVNVSHPSLTIDGIWVPLGIARLYSRGLPEGVESIFLSGDLAARFPTALQDFYEKSTPGRILSQFGPDFSTPRSSSGAGRSLDMPQCEQGKVAKDVWQVPVEAGTEEPLLPIPPSVNLALAALHPSTSTTEVTALPEMPLSSTEEEMFRALCVHPDWETEDEMTGPEDTHSPPRERPILRRSRRVADATAARRRAAPPRTKGPRHT